MRIRPGDGIGPGRRAFHSRFRRSIQFVDGAGLVAAVLPELGAGPHAVVMEDLPGGDTPELTLGDGWLEIGGCRYPFSAGDVYHSRPDWGVPDPDRLAAGIGSLKLVLRRRAPAESPARWADTGSPEIPASAFDRELAKRFVDGRRLLLGGDPAAGARRLHGAGRGLTPAGDDFLAGVLHGWRLRMAWWDEPLEARIEAVYGACAGGGNPFTETFLREARDGRVFERLEHVVRALLSGAVADVETAAERLCAVGATSGADLAAGLAAVLAEGRKG
jgi:hypothetical protein